MTKYKMLGKDGKEYGPFSIEQIQQLYKGKRANAQTKLRAEDSMDWKPLGSIPELASALGIVSPSIPVPSANITPIPSPPIRSEAGPAPASSASAGNPPPLPSPSLKRFRNLRLRKSLLFYPAILVVCAVIAIVGYLAWSNYECKHQHHVQGEQLAYTTLQTVLAKWDADYGIRLETGKAAWKKYNRTTSIGDWTGEVGFKCALREAVYKVTDEKLAPVSDATVVREAWKAGTPIDVTFFLVGTKTTVALGQTCAMSITPADFSSSPGIGRSKFRSPDIG